MKLSGLILMIVIMLLIVCTIKVAYYNGVEIGIFLATSIAAVAYPLTVLAERYIWIPQLKIVYEPLNNKDMYVPIFDVNSSKGQGLVKRKYIRVGVYNEGSKTAKNCVGVIVLEPNGRPQGCNAFSAEPKTLKWTRSVEPIDILPKQIEILNVAFTEDLLSEPFGGTCYHQAKNPHIRAWASTIDADKFPSGYLQDGFCQGDFQVKITIFSENADPVTRNSIISVGSNWDDLKI